MQTKFTIAVLCATVLTLIPASSKDWYAIWDSAGDTWNEKWDNVLNSIDVYSEDERFDLLGRAVMLCSDKQMSDEKRKIFTRAQAAMLAIPGHAEYFRDRINEARAEMDAVNPEENGDLWAYQRTQWKNAMSGFGVMAHVPSAEAVRVLGEYLADDRGRIPLPAKPTHVEVDDWCAHWPHSFYALIALNNQSLAGKPFRGVSPDGSIGPFEMENALVAWRQWYQEIKDGKRTFRFEGDPTEYDLNGPAPAEKLERSERDLSGVSPRITTKSD